MTEITDRPRPTPENIEKMWHAVYLMDEYAELEKGLDPIGASDMLEDLGAFTRILFIKGEFADEASAWEKFNEQVLQPKYYPNGH